MLCDVTVQLSENYGDCCPGAAVRIETGILGELHNELNKKAPAEICLVIESAQYEHKKYQRPKPVGD